MTVSRIGVSSKGISDRQNVGIEEHWHVIYAVNRLYTFFASNPALNAADGTGTQI